MSQIAGHKFGIKVVLATCRSSCSMQLFNEFDAVIIDEASEANSSTTKLESVSIGLPFCRSFSFSFSKPRN